MKKAKIAIIFSAEYELNEQSLCIEDLETQVKKTTRYFEDECKPMLDNVRSEISVIEVKEVGNDDK